MSEETCCECGRPTGKVFGYRTESGCTRLTCNNADFWRTKAQSLKQRLEAAEKVARVAMSRVVDNAVSRICDLDPDDPEEPTSIIVNQDVLIQILEDELQAAVKAIQTRR